MSLMAINIAYIFMLIAFMLRDLLWLRVILICAHLSFIVYSTLVGNYSMLGWNAVFLLINSVQAVILLQKRRPVELSPEMEKIYQNAFDCLKRKEFLYFWHTGREESSEEKYLVERGTRQNDLFYITAGKVEIISEGEKVTVLKPGDFIAETSIFLDDTVNIDARPMGEVKFIRWPQEVLLGLRKTNPEVLSKVERLVSRYMVKKLKRALGN
ncbi:MAG: cyclic nucleotide-binding domain-containing protein [Elusimicrobiota bacterium]